MCLLSLALSRNLLSQPLNVHRNYRNECQPKTPLLTSLSPCTVRCFLRDALSVNSLPQFSTWHLNVFTGAPYPDLPLPGLCELAFLMRLLIEKWAPASGFSAVFPCSWPVGWTLRLSLPPWPTLRAPLIERTFLPMTLVVWLCPLVASSPSSCLLACWLMLF